MDPTSDVGFNPMPIDHPSRSRLISHHLKDFCTKSNILHPQRTFTARLHEAELRAEMSSKATEEVHPGMPNTSDAPAELFEPRQTAKSPDFTPHPEKSLQLSTQRQQLLDDILALYCCEPTITRVKRYTPDAIYDDEFSYANDRYKIAGQWFAMPKIFQKGVNEGYEVVRSDGHVIQFKNKQSWTFHFLPKTITVTHLITLSLDPSTRDTDFMQIKYHKDQANDKDYSHEGVRFSFKKWQAEMTAKFLPNAPELEAFEADRGNGGKELRKWGTGGEEGDAPKNEYRT